MEPELLAGRPGNIDVLIVNAFSSDAIPAQFLTQTAFEVYLLSSAPESNGVLGFHVSGRPAIDGRLWQSTS